MTSTIEHSAGTVVILGTGGTIAGASSVAGDNVGYTAAQRSVADLLAAVPALAGSPVEAAQVAQLDSKDMDAATWQALARAVARQLARPAVQGIVITHGTDTLEETAWLLQAVLAPAKPVVLVAAMRPATALAADGPQNLLDAVAVARTPGARGVVAVLAGQVHAADRVRKVHTYRTDAFSSGDAGPLGVVEEGVLRRFTDWPTGTPLGLDLLDADPTGWPWVEIVTSHAAARGEGVRALVAAGVQGLVVAGTGNGSIHHALAAALDAASAAGLPVWRCSRCAGGVLVPAPGAVPSPAAGMSPWQARLALQLQLLSARRGGG
ncbi:asparaginase [Pseudaquabacterium pictum]|uniref:L-asparaginase n=1 Tax=Pseudaquabacterium pictum TaxID=2315236 RepID=A0A480AT64_9BURK|nr:asparaginase [Rubrivivax pictus]GCL61908.1 L-asparaginase [Rubrivivax pictus]